MRVSQKTSRKRGVLVSRERKAQALQTKRGRLKCGPGVPVRAYATSHPFPHPCPPHDPPCGSLWPAALQRSALLHSASLHSALGRPPPPCPPPPSSSCHHSPLIALKGWGPQAWTHPTVAPEPSWSDGRTVGRRTPEPRGGQCARVPHSLLKVSASGEFSYSGVLETRGAHLKPLIPDFRSQSSLYLRCA